MVSLPVRAHHHPPPLSGHAASGERWGFRVWPGLVAESGGVLLRACVTTACCEGPERAPFPGHPLLRRVAQGPTPPACASLDGLVVALTCGHSLAVLHPASCGPGPRKVRQRSRDRFVGASWRLPAPSASTWYCACKCRTRPPWRTAVRPTVSHPFPLNKRCRTNPSSILPMLALKCKKTHNKYE